MRICSNELRKEIKGSMLAHRKKLHHADLMKMTEDELYGSTVI